MAGSTRLLYALLLGGIYAASDSIVTRRDLYIHSSQGVAGRRRTLS